MIRFVLILSLVTSNIYSQEIIWNKSNQYGFTPAKGWADYSEGDDITYYLIKPGLANTFYGSISFSRTRGNNWMLDEVYKYYVINDFPVLMKDFKKTNEGKGKIGNLESRWIEFYAKSDNEINFYNLVTLVLKNNEVYTITCLSTPDRFELVREDFNNMIKSLKIK